MTKEYGALELWQRETLNEFAREATRKLIENDAEIERLRDRVNRLRGLCKSASGWLADCDDIEHADVVLDLIGDMEPNARTVGPDAALSRQVPHE